MASLAVVIVSWNVRELLDACLESLFADLSASWLDADIHVVDNASTDGTPAFVAEQYPQVQLTASPENLGFAAGNNLALRTIFADGSSRYDYVWLLNPDTEVRAGATSALRECLASRPAAAVAGPKLLYPDGSLQHGAFRFPGLVQLAFELFPLPARFYDTRLNGRYPPDRYGGDEPFAVDHPLGASMLVRAAAIAQVGFLDEHYRMYCEEIDWCWRMRRAGWRAWCAPGATIVHHAGQSSAQVPIASFVNLWTSRARLYTRFHGPMTGAAARLMVRVGMRRRMRSAAPEMRQACSEVLRVWRETA